MSNENKSITIEVVRTIAESCARSDYQRELLAGKRTWSGSDLKGAAAKWSSSYKATRTRLVNRIDKQLKPLGWGAFTDIRERRRVLILKAPDGAETIW